MNNPALQQAIQGQLLQTANAMEQQLDNEIERLDKMEEDDFEKLKVKRMEALKKAQSQKQEWLSNGHGKYTEVADEKEFFDACKRSKHVICHFYRDSAFRCKIVDKHFEQLAHQHVETKFIKINAERVKFLVEKLRIVVIPTICLAKEGKTTDYIVGFDDLGGVDDFPTEMMEWRLGRAGVINYKGDPLNPPKWGKQKSDSSVFGFVNKKKTIKDGRQDESSDEDDW